MKSYLLLLSIPVLLLCSACSSFKPVIDPNLLNHIITVKSDGKMDNLQSDSDEGNSLNISSDQYLDNIISNIENTKKDEKGNINVLLFFHGGLNSERGSFNRAKKIIENSKIPDNIYPIFVNWQSGGPISYWDHLWRIRQGEISGTAPLTSPIYFLNDVATSIVSTPQAWLVSGEHSVSDVLADYKGLDAYKSGDGNVLFTGDKPYSSYGMTTLRCLFGVAKPVTTPFVYTLAKQSWDQMLRRTSTLFYTPDDFDGKKDGANFAAKEAIPGNGALSRFLLKLNSAIKSKKLPVKVTLIGHSMGAIVVNKVLTLNLDIPYTNVVHMASADSTTNLFNKVIPYLRKNKETNFYSLSLHPKNEDFEASGLGTTPTGSLLVWIDEMYSTPENVMDRRSGRWENVERVKHLFPYDIKDRMHFKIFGLVDKDKQIPQEHGDFDDTRFWEKSTWWK